jgi:very-short-patch-repair endonuclease
MHTEEEEKEDAEDEWLLYLGWQIILIFNTHFNFQLLLSRRVLT